MISYQVLQHGTDLVRIENDNPQPKGKEVLLKVLAAGVCHTDIHTWEGSYDLGDNRRLNMQERGVKLPLTLGHETVGEVIEVGSETDRGMIGKRYIVYPWIGCGRCTACHNGKENMCPEPQYLGIFKPGGYSDHILVSGSHYLVEIGHLSPEQAAPYACSGLTTFSALRKFPKEILSSEAVVIMGAGGLGLMAISLLKALGGKKSIVIEPNAEKRKAALALGASDALDPNAPDIAEALKKANGGMVWAVLDCVGSEKTMSLALSVMAKGGHIVVVGLYGGSLQLSLPMIPLRCVTIQGSYVGNLQELKDLVQLISHSKPEPVPTVCWHLEHANQALHDLKAGKVLGRLILCPSLSQQ